MNRDSHEPDRKKSRSTPPELVIDEIIQTIERVDRKIEEFYEIHGTELKAISREQTELGRS
ncbi:MAG: hypothetical protein JSV50_09745 [Desulfobacteraceae bacterium]|nr:MAG: hypothetical protein JSV50_09745 [Desulfobacteraceae bacterium]